MASPAIAELIWLTCVEDRSSAGVRDSASLCLTAKAFCPRAQASEGLRQTGSPLSGMSLIIKDGVFFITYLFYYLCLGVLPACMYVWVRATDLGITDGCELPRGCQELNPSPPEEWSVLLTSEPQCFL